MYRTQIYICHATVLIEASYTQITQRYWYIWIQRAPNQMHSVTWLSICFVPFGKISIDISCWKLTSAELNYVELFARFWMKMWHFALGYGIIERWSMIFAQLWSNVTEWQSFETEQSFLLIVCLHFNGTPDFNRISLLVLERFKREKTHSKAHMDLMIRISREQMKKQTKNTFTLKSDISISVWFECRFVCSNIRFQFSSTEFNFWRQAFRMRICGKVSGFIADATRPDTVLGPGVNMIM